MPRATDLVILWLGTYRLWWLIAKDALTEPWRTRLLGYEDTGARNRWPREHKRLGEFVHCPWCLGFWIGLVAVVAYAAWPHATRWVLLPFAVSTLVGLTFAAFERTARK
jgi:Protein of unknown function (DUF1360)